MPQSSGLHAERTKKLDPSKGRAWSQSQAAASFAHPHGYKGFALQGQGMTVATRGKEFSQNHTRKEWQNAGRSNLKAECRKQ